MESAHARLSQVGFASREALDSECDPAEDVRVARAALLHAVKARGFEEHTVAGMNPRVRVWLPPVGGELRDTATDLPCAAP